MIKKEEIIEILSMSEPSEVLSAQLVELYREKQYNFSSVDNDLKHNVFYQLLFIKMSPSKKKIILQGLLSNSYLCPLAQGVDKNQQTILHHAARMDNADCLRILIKKLPGLLNKQNVFGNTALHIAVNNSQLANVQELVRHSKINRLLVNTKNKTALALADDIADPRVAEDIRHALEVDLTQIKLPGFLSGPSAGSSTSSSSLSASFPRLSSSPRHSFMPVSSSSSGEISLSWSNPLSNSSSSLSSSCPGTPSPRMSSPRSPIADKKDLLNQLNESSTETCRLLVQTLYTYCHSYDLNEESLPSIIEALKKRPDALQLINEFQQLSSPVLKEQTVKFKQQGEELLKALVDILLGAGINGELPPIKTPNFIIPLGHVTGRTRRDLYTLLKLTPEERKKITDPDTLTDIQNLKTAQTWLSTLWFICSGQTRKDDKRAFGDDVFVMLNHCALGLQNKLEFPTVLQYLRALFPLFDYHQQLMANYLVIQLLIYNAPAIIKQDSKTLFQLNLFSGKNIKERSLTGSQGQEIHDSLQRFLDSYKRNGYSYLLKNWETLAELSGEPNLHRTGDFFDGMVSAAIANIDVTPNVQISRIARELKMHCKAFYQRLSFHAYESKASAEIIREHTNYFNQVNNYFVAKIMLAKTALEQVNALRFMISLSQDLYASEEHYPCDTNHLKLASSVLNTTQISRLNDLFAQLRPEECDIKKEIDTFFAGGFGKWQQEASKADPDTLLPLCNLAGKCEATCQIENPVERLIAFGSVYLPQEQLTSRVQYSPIVYTSNLSSFLVNRTMVSDYKLDTISYKLQRPCFSPNAHTLFLDSMIEPNKPIDLSDGFKELDEVYLNRTIIPNVMFKNQRYPAEKITVILFDWAASVLSAPELNVEKRLDLIKEFRTGMLKLLWVMSTYEHDNHPPNPHPHLISQQLDEMEKALQAGEPFPREAPPVTADRPVRKSSMRISLFHNPFKNTGSGSSEPASSSKLGPG